MSSTTNSIQLQRLDSRIKSVWQRSQMLHLTAGILAFCRWAVLLFLAGVAVDWMMDIPAAGRVAFLITLLAISLYKAWQCGWRNLRAFNATHTALQLETHHGGLDSLLVSAVQLRDPAAVAGASESLRNRTCRLAEEAASILRPENAVPFRGLRRPATVVLLLAGLIGVFAVAGGPFLMAGLSRIFAPWLAVEYPTYTRLELGDGDLVVKQGASAQIEARVFGVVPDKAKLMLRTGEGRPREMVLDITDGTCEYTIASASRDFTYQIKAGDARSVWYRVRVIPAPRVEQVRVDLEFPAYLERVSETVEALTLTVPEGTGVNWQLTLDRPISEAVFIRDGEEPVELQVSEDGRRVKFSAMASDSRGYSFSWVEKEHGFDFTSSRYYLQVASDQPPRVELTSPATNLIAMLGRPLDLVVRARDDHAIAAAKVAYRVNRRQDESVALPSPIRNGEGEQSIDWDYRTALPDLDIGDTVSFAVEVSDHYPRPQGPHHARSETRRITFLSREEYLKQIGRKIDRLLSRVRAIYRQERAAHELVLNMDPEDDSFRQTCQLEAIRQEMLRNQLNETATEAQALLDDLAANNVSDAAEGASLEKVRLALLDIAESHIAQAASLLRDQSGSAEDTQGSADPNVAARPINTAARELGSLVLLRDIDSAQEVYAREARMLAQTQAYLRWRTAEAEAGPNRVSGTALAAGKPGANEPAASAVPLTRQQDELAQWTDRLISDLQNGMRYDKRPLAVLRLIRSVKDLRGAQTEERMRQAAVLITQGQADQAEGLQAELVTTLLDAEFSVRLSGAYSTLIKTRDQMRLIVNAQAMLREQCAGMSAQDFATRRTQTAQAQKKLRKRLLTLLLPTVPAPRPQLFDETLPQAPPVQALLKEADRAMARAIEEFAAGQQDAAISQQREAEQALTHLAGLVDRWSVELGLQTLGLSTLVAVTGERLALIEEYEAKVIALLEKTDIAAADEQKVDGLAEPQLLLTEEIAAFNSDLVKQNQSKSDQDIPPLLSRMERAERAMRSALASLEANDADQAIGHQEQAADILAEAYAIVATQNEQLGLLQSLLMFQRSVGFASGYMADIVAQQRDMIAETKALESEDVSHLMPLLGNLRRCIDDVAPLLDMVAARVDAGSPLVFAAADLEDAVASLEGGDKLDALDAQDVVAESLEEVNTLVKAVKSQTGYVAEIVEFLHIAVADTATLEYQQDELARKTESATPDQLKALAAEQRELLARTKKNAQVLELVTGGIPAYSEILKGVKDRHKGKGELELPKEMPAYTEPAKLMREALARLESDDATAAAEQMELASTALKENAESLFAVISMLHGLPNMEMTLHTEPGVERLVNVMVVASAHKILFRDTNNAEAQAMKALADQQGELATRCQELSKVGEPHAMLETASSQLVAAATAMQSPDRDAIKHHQKAAMQTLRHFIIEQALILETAVPLVAAVEGDPTADGPGSDTESAFAAGFISDFVSGETPKDQRTGWKVRGDRNRAALNQNFARELPLEYRGLLKNYYERVAK